MNKVTYLLKKIFTLYDNFIRNNKVVKKIICLQHKYLPLPFSVFGCLYKSKIGLTLFRAYGAHCFNSAYHAREDNISYWMSKESLYWHLFRQTDTDNKLLEECLAIPQVKQFMMDSSLVAVELGFGIGKNYKTILRNNNLFKQYIAVEPNEFVYKHAKNKFNDPNLLLVNESIEEFISGEKKFDVLLIFGGVLMYLPEEEIDSLFNRFRDKGVKRIVILNEGTSKEEFSGNDNVTMYNFRKRLERVGYSGNFIENVKNVDNGVLNFFIMY